MNPKTLHNLTWIPPMLIGLLAICLGLVWLITKEPWLLDKSANEALLGTTYTALFAAPVNAHMPDYLTLTYRFFGWWVLAIGLLIMTFVQVTRMGTRLARNSLHVVILVILVGIYIIEYRFIPSSPFVWLTHGLSGLWLLSVFAAYKLKAYD